MIIGTSVDQCKSCSLLFMGPICFQCKGVLQYEPGEQSFWIHPTPCHLSLTSPVFTVNVAPSLQGQIQNRTWHALAGGAHDSQKKIPGFFSYSRQKTFRVHESVLVFDGSLEEQESRTLLGPSSGARLIVPQASRPSFFGETETEAFFPCRSLFTCGEHRIACWAVSASALLTSFGLVGCGWICCVHCSIRYSIVSLASTHQMPAMTAPPTQLWPSKMCRHCQMSWGWGWHGVKSSPIESHRPRAILTTRVGSHHSWGPSLWPRRPFLI